MFALIYYAAFLNKKRCLIACEKSNFPTSNKQLSNTKQACFQSDSFLSYFTLHYPNSIYIKVYHSK